MNKSLACKLGWHDWDNPKIITIEYKFGHKKAGIWKCIKCGKEETHRLDSW